MITCRVATSVRWALLLFAIFLATACSPDSDDGDDNSTVEPDDDTSLDDDTTDDDADDDADDDSVAPPPCGPVIEPLVEGRVISDADLATLADGSLAVVWSERNSLESHVVVRVCAADGDGFGPVDIEAGEADAMDASEPAVAPLPSGGFVIVYLADSGSTLRVAARWFDGATQPTTPVVSVAEVADPDTDPAIGVDPQTGDALVAWGMQPDAGDDHELSGRVFDASGEPSSNVFAVASVHALSWQSPSVAAMPTDEFAVAWSGIAPTAGTADRDEPADDAAIWLSTYDHEGNAVLGPVVPDVETYGSSAFPSIAIFASGLAFGWSTGSVAYANVLGSGFEPMWDSSALLSDSYNRNGLVSVAALDDETILAVWYTTEYEEENNEAETHTLEAAKLSAEGERLADLHVLGSADTLFEAGYRIAPFGDDGFVVVAFIYPAGENVAELTLIHCVWDGEPGCNPEL